MHEERRQVIFGLLVEEEANSAVEQESQRRLQAEE
jgi:hypothetical protein